MLLTSVGDAFCVQSIVSCCALCVASNVHSVSGSFLGSDHHKVNVFDLDD